MNQNKKLQKCFISASANLKTKPLLNFLEDKGIDAFDIYSLPSKVNVISSLKTKIRNSDFVIAILNLENPNPNVLYEVGMAHGLNKPIFLIVEGEGSIPLFMKDYAYVRARMNDFGVIDFVLSKFLSMHKKSPQRTVRIKETSKNKRRLKKLKEEYKKNLSFQSASRLNDFVADLFRSENIILEKSKIDTGIDLSMWIDSLNFTIGNPILVETKIGKLSNEILDHSEEKLRRYITRTNSGAGLLVYCDESNKVFKQTEFRLPLVIRLSLDNLIDKLEKKPIENIILEERNAIAHHMGSE